MHTEDSGADNGRSMALDDCGTPMALWMAALHFLNIWLFKSHLFEFPI